MSRAAALGPSRAAMGPRQSHATGVLFCLAGTTCWSLAGVLIRSTDGIDAWQISFYRSLVVCAFLGAYLYAVHRGRFLAVIVEAGTTAMIAGAAIGLASIAFVLSLFYTTVAQSIFMVGVAPFVAALLGLWVLRERVAPSTWVAMTVALAGLAIMLGGGWQDGGAVVGSILALYSAFCFSVYSVLLRWGQRSDMNVAILWNAVLLIALSAVVLSFPNPLRAEAGAGEFHIGWRNFLFICIMGVVQIGLGLILFTRGSRSVPAAELALIALVEPTLSPIWVWLAVGEVPAATTIVGGAIIMGAIVLRVVAGSRRPQGRTR